MTRKNTQNGNNAGSDSSFWNFLDFLIYLAAFLSDFVLRISKLSKT
jgi:hypothetical protein